MTRHRDDRSPYWHILHRIERKLDQLLIASDLEIFLEEINLSTNLSNDQALQQISSQLGVDFQSMSDSLNAILAELQSATGGAVSQSTIDSLTAVQSQMDTLASNMSGAANPQPPPEPTPTPEPPANG